MNSSEHALADAIAQSVIQQGSTEPSVRGGDWHTAVVTAVGSDGTVDCGTIRARRHRTYQLPQVGDWCVLLRSGTGNYLALAPMEAAGSGGWQTLPLAAGFSTGGGGITPAYLLEGPKVTLRGRITHSSGTIDNAATIATIPPEIRPYGGANFAWASPRNSSTYPAVCRVEITNLGALRTYETADPPVWISLDNVSYTTI